MVCGGPVILLISWKIGNYRDRNIGVVLPLNELHSLFTAVCFPSLSISPRLGCDWPTHVGVKVRDLPLISDWLAFINER